MIRIEVFKTHIERYYYDEFGNSHALPCVFAEKFSNRDFLG